jgi:4-amino-4-deoxy-L-arabinose transferase-like glycosyltransferase
VFLLLRQHRGFFLGTACAGLILRLIFIVYFPAITDDSHIYADLATNWMQHGIYGVSSGGQAAGAQARPITPTDSRLPGYPAFLAGIFFVFGIGNLKSVMLVQSLFDIGACLIVCDIARRLLSSAAARVAFLAAALCPFLANYSAAVLTETLEIFFTALALDLAVAALERTIKGSGNSLVAAGERRRATLLWAATGLAISACILLRPDGGIVLAAVLLYLLILIGARFTARNRGAEKRVRHYFAAPIMVAVFAFAPLVPWAIRNFRTLHHFQPLAPRYANDTDELVLRGFNRWVKTWMADYASVEEIYWNVPGEKIDASKLPARAMESTEERETTLALVDEYNDSTDISPELDAEFGGLAAERIRRHPMRYWVGLPLVRVADMWLRPRTEILPPDARWWEFNDDWKRSAVAVGFGTLNLIYAGAALLALIGWRSRVRCAGLLICFLVLRSAMLSTLENPEPRYTLEGYPAIIVLAAALFERRKLVAVSDTDHSPRSG